MDNKKSIFDYKAIKYYANITGVRNGNVTYYLFLIHFIYF